MKNTINTTLTHHDSDEPITFELENIRAFSDVFGLGLILSSKRRFDSQFATDASGLQHVKDGLEYVQNQCLWGLQGIGALMVAANPSDMCKDDLANVGGLIQHLSQLAEDAIGHMESVNSDLVDRSNRIEDPNQAAHHAKVHRMAIEIWRKQRMSYADAMAMAVSQSSVRQADAGSTEEA